VVVVVAVAVAVVVAVAVAVAVVAAAPPPSPAMFRVSPCLLWAVSRSEGTELYHDTACVEN
jgi:hypothetical protein